MSAKSNNWIFQRIPIYFLDIFIFYRLAIVILPVNLFFLMHFALFEDFLSVFFMHFWKDLWYWDCQLMKLFLIGHVK